MEADIGYLTLIGAFFQAQMEHLNHHVGSDRVHACATLLYQGITPPALYRRAGCASAAVDCSDRW
jgi:hypothetical protein